MIPSCIGIIMDGNRRWARKNNFPLFEGHRRGYAKIKEAASWAKEAGVGTLILYVFSTENWNRPKEEIGFLMDLFRWIFKNEIKYLKNQKIKITAVGQKALLPEDIQKEAARIEKETKHFSGLHIVLAISYGGRSEILSAVKDIVRGGLDEESVTEETFKNHLWTKGIPDPDIIIRSGGEKRLSNFLPWQSVYSEMFFVDSYWPEFSKEEFSNILAEYSKRERRRGK